MPARGRAGYPQRQSVVLIHGIMADRDWYRRASRSLPDYQCLFVNYHEYDTVFAPLQLAAARLLLWVALLSATTWTVLTLQDMTFPWLFWMAMVALILYAPTAWFADRWRTTARRAVIDQLARAFRHNRYAPFHVVAHSFGTVLLGEALGFLPVPLWDRIVLVGSALPRAFPWHDLLYGVSPRLPAFRSVRNEMGSKDIVIRLASVSCGLLIPGIGGAGLRGFLSPPAGHQTFVHDVGTPLGPCGDCAGGPIRTGTIHNVELAQYRHSDFFLTELHARLLWRPVLWGLEPWEWCDLLVRSVQIVDLLDQKQKDDAEKEIDDLCSERYRWTDTTRPPRQVRDYVREKILAKVPRHGPEVDVDQVILDVLKKACRYIVEANAVDTPKPDLAYPPYAIRDAVLIVVRRTDERDNEVVPPVR